MTAAAPCPIEVVVATANVGKLREIRRVAAGSRVRWLGLDAFADLPAPVESGDTFAENARIKALHYAGLTGLYALADDSGLVVDALGGLPGVHSARYAGAPRDDAANNRKLIAALRGVPPEQRTARFVCAMVFGEPGRMLLGSSGVVEGLVVDEPRGAQGFGYDPHFLIPSLGRTAAELSPEQKSAVSHRGQALRAILPQIEWHVLAGNASVG